MNKSLCTKELYCTFLRVTSQRYSALSLSEVSPIELSHDSIPVGYQMLIVSQKIFGNEAKTHILGTSGVLIVDDTILDKQRSDNIELVRYQYSGNAHDVIKESVCSIFYGLTRR